jgi:hypothetical protein
VPVGGATGTVLGKNSATNFDTAWIGPMLPLAGGTLTGALTIAPASGNSTLTLNSAAGNNRNILGQTAGVSRWSIVAGNFTAEGGSNAGSDFQINRFNDAGSVIDTPLTINRASATATFAGSVISQAPGGNGFLVSTAAGQNRSFFGQTNSVTRWALIMGNTTAEGGSNAGSDFSLSRYADNGSFLGFPITAVRSTGVVTFAAAIVNGPSDRTLKQDIAPLEGALDKVLALQGVSFSMIDDETGRRQIGLVAQDVMPVVPEVIQDYQAGDGEAKLALDYPKLVALLIEAIRELNAKLEASLALH